MFSFTLNIEQEIEREDFSDQFYSCLVASFHHQFGLSSFSLSSMSCLSLFLCLCPLTAEAERIRKCKGRVFALQDEPEVARVWLPNNDSPGLAMARAFGDFCLKDYGLISVPDISYRRITEKDVFIVLATDGVREPSIGLLSCVSIIGFLFCLPILFLLTFK